MKKSMIGKVYDSLIGVVTIFIGIFISYNGYKTNNIFEFYEGILIIFISSIFIQYLITYPPHNN